MIRLFLLWQYIYEKKCQLCNSQFLFISHKLTIPATYSIVCYHFIHSNVVLMNATDAPGPGAIINFVAGRRVHPIIKDDQDLLSGNNIGILELAIPYDFNGKLWLWDFFLMYRTISEAGHFNLVYANAWGKQILFYIFISEWKRKRISYILLSEFLNTYMRELGLSLYACQPDKITWVICFLLLISRNYTKVIKQKEYC